MSGDLGSPTPPGLAAAGGGRPAAGNRAHRMAWSDVQRTELNMLFGPAADPTNSHWINKFDLDNGPKLFWGRVVDVVPYVNAYKVQVERGVTTMLCTMAVQSSLQPTGAREYGQLTPGTAVYFLLHHDSTFGLIIAVEPEHAIGAQAGVADFISQAGRSGLSVDDAHKAVFRMDNSGLLGDWSAGRPFDQTAAGEKGHITELGLANHIDSFMTFLRVDEECGVWGFHHDSLLRVAGHNLQLWSACREREDLDDEGEVSSVEGYTPYYWEGLGAFSYGDNCGPQTSWLTTVPERYMPGLGAQFGTGELNTAAVIGLPGTLTTNLSEAILSVLSLPDGTAVELDDGGHRPSIQGGTAPTPYEPPYSCEACVNGVFARLTPEQWQLDPALQCYSAVEPCYDDQQGFYRLRDFYGYLGQAHKRHLQLPPQPVPDFVQTYPAQLQSPGVYEENLSLTGRKSIRTAHEYVVMKRLAIPSPKQIRRQEDTGGDKAANYKAAGTLGAGRSHAVTGQLPNEGSEDDGMVHALGFLDKQAYVFNWEGSHPFAYHTRDWYLPEEGDLGYCPSALPTDYSELQVSPFLATPAPVALFVDHRYQSVNYYPNMSYWALLESGGSLWGDGFGTEFWMENGRAFIDTPGDLYIRAGRNVNIEAGKDVTVKAKYSVDVSATLKDVRVKAERGVYVLGGNDGCGGVLIESKAMTPNIDFAGKQGEDVTLGGIILKAPESMVGVCSTMHLHTVPCTRSTEQTPVFLINMPGGRIRSMADYDERFLVNAAFDIFVEGDSCDSLTIDTDDGTPQTARGPQDGPQGFVSADTSGAATVPVMLGVAGPVGTGFLGAQMPLQGAGTFHNPLVTLHANEYWPGRATMCGALRVTGEIVSADSIFVNGDVCTAYGHFFSSRAPQVGGRVSTLKGTTLSAVLTEIAVVEERCAELVNIANTELNAFVAHPFLSACTPEFTYRTTGQYATEGWKVPEPRWHQINRAARDLTDGREGEDGAPDIGTENVWTETPVWTSDGDPTYPYPGYEAWAVNESLLRMDTRLHDLYDGLAFDRDNGLYEDPGYGEGTSVVPDGAYPTIY